MLGLFGEKARCQCLYCFVQRLYPNVIHNISTNPNHGAVAARDVLWFGWMAPLNVAALWCGACAIRAPFALIMAEWPVLADNITGRWNVAACTCANWRSFLPAELGWNQVLLAKITTILVSGDLRYNCG